MLAMVSTLFLTSRSGRSIIILQDDPDAARNANSDNIIGMNFCIFNNSLFNNKGMEKIVFN